MKLANYYPDRIVLSYKRANSLTKLQNSFIKTYDKAPPAHVSDKCKENLSKKKSSLDLSMHSRRTLRNSCNSLVFLSQPRTVYTPQKKPIYNFRAAFITLTLPSIQKHTDVELKKCLDLFLQDLRRVYKVQNYVWRSELQDNGNIHFHLLVDKYIYHRIIRKYWLKALRHTGYVKEYQRKFINMSFVEYREYRRQLLKKEPENFHEWNKKIHKAYMYGKETNWLSPNATDIKNVQTMRQIASYVSKYMAKKDRDEGEAPADPPAVPITPERIENFGKVWGRSTSLSQLKYKFPYVYESSKAFIDQLISSGSVYTKVYDWVTIHYFNFQAMPSHLYRHIKNVIFSVARTWNYPQPAT